MATLRAVWGIDLGQCALKAMRCSLSAEGEAVTIEAFDYIEYSQILSQPDADAVELVREALKQFLSRNQVRGDKVLISVPGHAGLAKFTKLPPVEAKRIPDIVRYEARQQIPFPLDEVVWDYQRMIGGTEEEGFALETEIGIFAMKKEHVQKALKPFEEAGIEVHVVQLSPLALFNYAYYDQIKNLPTADEYDPDEPPEYMVLLSMGCDQSDLVVTNGFRIWLRNMPIGGNHFTKALVKEFNLPFSKAEHLKRNPSMAEDQKAVFQAMRPVFTELVNEVQRSLNYYQNVVDRNARFGKVIGLGGTMKLPGIRTFLTQNVGYEVERLDKFDKVQGPAVLTSPIFKEHLLSFATCFGLALQGLGKSKLHTTLLPKDIEIERKIREKKPWAVAAAAALLVGLTTSALVQYWMPWRDVVAEPRFLDVEVAHDGLKNDIARFKTTFNNELVGYEVAKGTGTKLVENLNVRDRWLALTRAVTLCLPPYTDEEPLPLPENPTNEDKITYLDQINIICVESQEVDDLSIWWKMVQALTEARARAGGANPNVANNNGLGGPNAGNPNQAAPAGPTGPVGKGWVIRISGYHYHNPDIVDERGVAYLQKTLLKRLNQDDVEYLDENGKKARFPIKKLGIGYPVLIRDTGIQAFDPKVDQEIDHFNLGIVNAQNRGGNNPAGMNANDAGGRRINEQPQANAPAAVRPREAGASDLNLQLRRTDFQIEFVWQESAIAPAAPVGAIGPGVAANR